MNFEEWGAEEEQRGLTTVEEMYADWRIEREKLIGALEDNEHFKNAVEKFCEEKQGQQNMSDKLEGFSTGWIAVCAVLAEVIGEKKELPKFKDIIGLFVDKPEQEEKV